MVKIVQKMSNNCQNVGQVMFPHHSDKMSQRSQVSRVALCMSKVKVLSVSQWVTQSVTRSPIELFWTAKKEVWPLPLNGRGQNFSVTVVPESFPEKAPQTEDYPERAWQKLCLSASPGTKYWTQVHSQSLGQVESSQYFYTKSFDGLTSRRRGVGARC